ncbi:hypothetical protein BDY19DRAFT_944313, partial [Irpex rosettiformis]
MWYFRSVKLLVRSSLVLNIDTSTRRRSPQLNSDAAVWGLAAIYSYKAYNDQLSLRFAQSMWAQ